MSRNIGPCIQRAQPLCGIATAEKFGPDLRIRRVFSGQQLIQLLGSVEQYVPKKPCDADANGSIVHRIGKLLGSCFGTFCLVNNCCPALKDPNASINSTAFNFRRMSSVKNEPSTSLYAPQLSNTWKDSSDSRPSS